MVTNSNDEPPKHPVAEWVNVPNPFTCGDVSRLEVRIPGPSDQRVIGVLDRMSP
jgi:hypothetical protein